MYICICQGITEDQVKKVAGHSANVDEALKKLGIGESCGICLIDALNKFGVSKNTSGHTQPHTPSGAKLKGQKTSR